MKKAAREVAAFFEKKRERERKGRGGWPREDCAQGAACAGPPG